MTTLAATASKKDTPLAINNPDFSTPHNYIDVETCRLAYWKTGAGPDLVFIHGWPVNAATYRNLIPRLAQDFTCHIFDLPGTGHSNGVSCTQFNFHAHTEALRSALKKLGITHFGIIAHDSGGIIARMLADQESEAVVGVSVSGTEIPGYYSPLLRSLFMTIHTPGALRVFTTLLRFRWFRHSNLGFGSCFYNKSLTDGEFYTFFIEAMLRDKKQFLGQMQFARAFNMQELDQLKAVHQRLKMPVQLIWGDRDPFFPARKAEGMLHDLPAGSSFHLIKNAKTFVHEEHPETVAQLAKAFMDARFCRNQSPALQPIQ